MFKQSLYCAACTAIAALPAFAAASEVTEYEDKSAWQADIGAYTTVDFTGFEWGTIITDQYADLGVLFTDGDDTIAFGDAFPNDARGLDGDCPITIKFNQAQQWIGVDFPGALTIHLYRHGTWIYTSSDFAGPGHGFFAGLISSTPFDEVVLADWIDDIAGVDDFHFGVPSPGAWCLMALAGLAARRRRRH